MANLKVKKGDTIYTIKLYDTEAAAGQPGETTGTLKLKMGNTNYFARITQHLGSDAAGGATPLRYKSSSGAIYQVTQKGEFVIIVPASDNQTVCVSAIGQTVKGANDWWLAEGTEWKAWVESANSDYIAGSLNLTGGILNSTVALSVTPAIKVPSGSKSYEYDYRGTQDMTFTVPENVTVIHVQGTSPNDSDLYYNNTFNIKVTPGKTYPIHAKRSGWKSSSHFVYDYYIYFNGLEVSKYHQGKVSMSISWSGAINAYTTDHDFS